MNEDIAILRACWSDAQIDFDGKFNPIEAMAMEPKPLQGGQLPIWVGGFAPQALKRIGELADGWLAPALADREQAARMFGNRPSARCRRRKKPGCHRSADDAGHAAPGATAARASTATWTTCCGAATKWRRWALLAAPSTPRPSSKRGSRSVRCHHRQAGRAARGHPGRSGAPGNPLSGAIPFNRRPSPNLNGQGAP